MEHFNVKALGMEEMTTQEMVIMTGGIPWGEILKALARFVAEAVAAWGIDEILSNYFHGDNADDDWCYWAYGGELDAAICEG